MDKIKLENMHFNGKMMDDDPNVILDRFDAMSRASDAIRQAYLDDQGEDYEAPVDFENAVNYATNALYRGGSAVPHPDDAAVRIERDVENEILAKKNDWIPETQEQLDLAKALLIKGSYLAIYDNKAAYKAHRKGRNFEFLDPYDTTYNKFGILVYPRHDK
ncbi:MAG: hypothetical protein V4611_02225 [Patescibacteria group bacterium]